MRWALLLTALIVPAAAGAEVVDQAPHGFTLRAVVPVAAPPDRLFAALQQVGSWWDGAHSYSGNAANMSLAAQVGGCFCERWTGGSVEHGRVVGLAPGSMLRLSAALGPLQALGVAGSLTFEIAAAGQGSTLTVTYAVGGYTPGGLESWATPVDGVITQAAARLKAYAER